ncbi:MAG: lysophospholipid acyltransferase family protein [Gemmatimonadaceae bacterium]
MQRLVNAWVWTETVLLALFGFIYVSVVWLATAAFDPGRYAAGRAFRRLAVAATALNPYWRFRTTGVTIADPRRPYVVVANHESYADIFLVSHLKWEMKWLAKDTLFRIPVMGWMMRMAGDVPINRGSRGSGQQALEACRVRLARKVSVMIFPEGTRSRNDELLPFKDGAFQLAISTGTPIIPIAIAGTRDAMAKGSFSFRRANAICEVLEPIPTTGLTSADVTALRVRTQQTISDARRELQCQLDAERKPTVG